MADVSLTQLITVIGVQQYKEQQKVQAALQCVKFFMDEGEGLFD